MVQLIIWGSVLAVTAFISKKIYDFSIVFKKKKAQRENEAYQARKKIEQEQEEKKLSKAKDDIKDFEHSWAKRFESIVLVDSNVWMNRDYENFFKELEWLLLNLSKKIKMSSVQFDEIVNLKNLPYEHIKSQLARCALTRIEQFQKKNLIDIIPMGVNAKRGAYADPIIISLLVDALPTNSSMLLVSDDTELRIRANQIMKDKKAIDFKSTMGQELYDYIKKYHSNFDLVKQSHSKQHRSYA